MGLLTISNATLNIDTLWPAGESDADTLKLDVSHATFEFRPHDGTEPTITKIFESASASSQSGTKPCVDVKNRISVRLQAVDAPELHNLPQLPSVAQAPELTPEQRKAFKNFNFNFRQPLAEDAVVRLRAALLAFGKNIVQVRFESRIDLPGELFDCYGRAIGDVFVTEDGPELWINRWLLEQGLAFASYYDSMTPEEIDDCNMAWACGKQKADGVWLAGYQAGIPPINPKMVFSKHVPGPVQDKALTYPKVFRRQTEWWARDQATIGPPRFLDYLRSRVDEARATREFLSLGRAAKPRKFADYISDDETLRFEPEDLIFGEEPSTLVDSGISRAVISSWSLTKQPLWSTSLSARAWVNSVAISGDGGRIAAATFLHNYEASAMILGTYALAVFDGEGQQLWARSYPQKLDGIFSVAISGDGSVVAAGGCLSETQGLLCVCDAQTGDVVFEDKALPMRVNAVAISGDGAIVAAASDKIHILTRRDAGYVSLDPADGSLDLDGDVKAIAIHPSGRWLVAGDQSGTVALITLEDGAIGSVHCWKAPDKPADRTNPASSLGPIPFLRAAVAGQSNEFAIAGGDFVYCFTTDGFQQGLIAAELDTWDGDTPNGQRGNANTGQELVQAENIRSIALSDDGRMLAVVSNRRIARDATGAVLVYRDKQQKPAWKLRLPRNPNDVSLTRDGGRIAIADGHPPGYPAGFLVFDGDGHELWQYPTSDMNWPIAISRDKPVLAAGGDDGNLYYFEL